MNQQDQDNMNEAHDEAADLRVANGLTPMPDPIYGDLAVVVALLTQIKAHEATIREMWETVEDVALGTPLECGCCGNYKPCKCDKGTPFDEVIK